MRELSVLLGIGLMVLVQLMGSWRHILPPRLQCDMTAVNWIAIADPGTIVRSSQHIKQHKPAAAISLKQTPALFAHN